MRLPETYEDRWRAKDYRQPPSNWPPAIDGRLMVSDYSFGRGRRISSAHEFAVFRQSKFRRRAKGFLLVLKRSAVGDRPRLAIVASRKVGNSVKRNLIRRRIREIFRQFPWPSPAPLDWLVVLRREAQGLTYDNLAADFSRSATDLLKEVERNVNPGDGSNGATRKNGDRRL